MFDLSNHIHYSSTCSFLKENSSYRKKKKELVEIFSHIQSLKKSSIIKYYLTWYTSQ